MSDDGRESESCVAAPALSDMALLVAIDEDADENVLAHLHICPHCAGRVQRLRRLQQGLRAHLYRLFCPTSDLLIEYCRGLLDAEQQSAIAHHIALCPACAHELQLLERCDGSFRHTVHEPGRDKAARLIC